MNILRTPDSAFLNLPDYPFSPNYIDVGGKEAGEIRMHYVDEGPTNGPVVLMLHGEPSWSYLFRKMIEPVANEGYRVIVPDLIGFGRSDKPEDQDEYTYAKHLNWLSVFIKELDIKNITLVCQDWGGLLGLRLVGEHSELFSRVLAANTFLPTGDHPPGEDFLQWLRYSQEVPEFPASGVINRGTTQPIAKDVLAAYDAPFPDESYKAGARKFPTLVPIAPDDVESENNRRAWKHLESFNKPFLTAFSDSDPITRGAEKYLQSKIPGCRGQAHATISDAGHFLQEDKGEALADVLIEFLRSD